MSNFLLSVGQTNNGNVKTDSELGDKRVSGGERLDDVAADKHNKNKSGKHYLPYTHHNITTSSMRKHTSTKADNHKTLLTGKLLLSSEN